MTAPAPLVLLTGGTSFTGLHFARRMAATGLAVTVACRQPRAAYMARDDLRHERARLLESCVECIWDAAPGTARFTALCASRPWDVLCLHAAQTQGYDQPGFDVAAAVASNLAGLPAAIDAMPRKASTPRLHGVVVTGSAFERGTTGPPISPYGEAKLQTWQRLVPLLYARGIPAIRFTLPNPFGCYEEPRLAASLFTAWRQDLPGVLRTPRVVRDEIPVSLLAHRYAATVWHTCRLCFSGTQEITPTCWYNSRLAFALRLATQTRERTGWTCQLTSSGSTSKGDALPRGQHCVSFLTPQQQREFWDEYIGWYTERAA